MFSAMIVNVFKPLRGFYMRGMAGVCQLSQPVHGGLYRHRLWTWSELVAVG